MKLTSNNHEFIAEHIPMDAFDFSLSVGKTILFYLRPSFQPNESRIEQLPPNVDCILGTYINGVIDFEDKVKHGWIEDCPYYAKMWKNYNEKGKHDVSKACRNPSDSFASLLQSKLENDKRYLIIKMK